MNIPFRILGRTGVTVTCIGLGGEGVLRTFNREKEAYDLINRAIDLGINYFESARAYAGSESYYGKTLRDRRKGIFLTSKSHARDKHGAMAHLQETLKMMHTDHLDLWQVHDMRTEDDIREVFGPGGAMESFLQAREKGMARFIGVTGHHDPAILRKCIEIADFDTVLMPVNPAEAHYKSFIKSVLPVAEQKSMGIVAMKVYFRGFAARIPWYESMEPFLHFALSHPVSTAVIGCDSIQQLEENVGFASRVTPMSEEKRDQMLKDIGPYARQLMYYKP
jgi:aryl-alcohol dehydrogenase-like predicted oxidoreductase